MKIPGTKTKLSWQTSNNECNIIVYAGISSPWFWCHLCHRMSSNPVSTQTANSDSEYNVTIQSQFCHVADKVPGLRMACDKDLSHSIPRSALVVTVAATGAPSGIVGILPKIELPNSYEYTTPVFCWFLTSNNLLCGSLPSAHCLATASTHPEKWVMYNFMYN